MISPKKHNAVTHSMASGSTSPDSNGKGPFQYSPTIQLFLGDVHKDFPFLCDRKYETTLQLVMVL